VPFNRGRADPEGRCNLTVGVGLRDKPKHAFFSSGLSCAQFFQLAYINLRKLALFLIAILSDFRNQGSSDFSDAKYVRSVT
jgi:hypothetical protein